MPRAMASTPFAPHSWRIERNAEGRSPSARPPGRSYSGNPRDCPPGRTHPTFDYSSVLCDPKSPLPPLCQRGTLRSCACGFQTLANGLHPSAHPACCHSRGGGNPETQSSTRSIACQHAVLHNRGLICLSPSSTKGDSGDFERSVALSTDSSFPRTWGIE